MKKVILTLGFLAVASTLFVSPVRANDKVRRAIVVGNPFFNPDIKRPGPYTPQPQPQPKQESTTKCLELADDYLLYQF